MSKLGVIVARFQVPYLHEGHRFIIKKALAENENVLVVLGESGGIPTSRDPLDFTERMRMIKTEYPSVWVRRIRDIPDDTYWSSDLDAIIDSYKYTATLYGGPDSFLPHYKGAYPTVQVDVPKSINGTDLRRLVEPPTEVVRMSTFREGMIYAANLRRPMSFQTVDIAIIKDWTDPQHVLMGSRLGDDGLRFPGGFVDPADESLEYAARREAAEEVPHMSADGFSYLGSFRINDWRYRNAPDKIMTALFIAYHQYGDAIAGDDFKEARWVPLDNLLKVVASVHRPLADAVVGYITPLRKKVAREEQRVR